MRSFGKYFYGVFGLTMQRHSKNAIRNTKYQGASKKKKSRSVALRGIAIFWPILARFVFKPKPLLPFRPAGPSVGEAVRSTPLRGQNEAKQLTKKTWNFLHFFLIVLLKTSGVLLEGLCWRF
jgi:hypothetical protein